MSAGHDHSHAPASFNRAFAIGIGLNIVFVAVEAFYGWKINSLALLADAGHNLSDVAGLVRPGVARWPASSNPTPATPTAGNAPPFWRRSPTHCLC